MSNNALRVAAGAATQTDTREQTPYEAFRNYVSRPAFVVDLKTLLGGEAAAKAFVRVVLTAVQQTPDLLSADRRTLLLACMKAAHARLMPDGKEAVLNIFSTKVKDRETGAEKWVKQVQFMPMSFGLVKSLYESGVATYVDAAAVYEKDRFSYTRGDTQSLVHEPTMQDEPGPVVCAYCVVKLSTGETKREVMPRRDIEKVRAISKTPDGLMWGKFYDQGAIKSVIHRICKQLPSRPEIEEALAGDNEAMGFAQSGTTGIDIDGDSFSGTPTSEERPAIEHRPGESVPTSMSTKFEEREHVLAEDPGFDAAANVKQHAKEAPKAKAKTSDGGFTSTYAQVRAALESAKTDDAKALARDMIRGVSEETQRKELEEVARLLFDVPQ